MKMKPLIILMSASFIFILGCEEEEAKPQHATTAEKDSEDSNNLLLNEFNSKSNYIDFSETDITEKCIQTPGIQTNIQGKHIIIESGNMHYPMTPGDKTLIDDRWRLETK